MSTPVVKARCSSVEAVWGVRGGGGEVRSLSEDLLSVGTLSGTQCKQTKLQITNQLFVSKKH